MLKFRTINEVKAPLFHSGQVVQTLARGRWERGQIEGAPQLRPITVQRKKYWRWTYGVRIGGVGVGRGEEEIRTVPITLPSEKA
tara:strand:+ start:1237 stop:1488 length:252 start_codon:yes stop_codon:yes gene_type:complete